MNKLSFAFAGLAAVAGWSAVAWAADGEQGELAFAASGREFTLQVPAGYCPPKGADIARARAVAEIDSVNYTPVDLQKCGTTGKEYVLVKYSREGSVFDATRAEFIALLKSEFQGPGADQALAEGAAQANADIADASGGSTRVEMPDYGYSGADDVCVYMSGALSLTSGDRSVSGRAATCITLVDGQSFAIHAYDMGGTTRIATLKARSAAVARSIRPK